MRDLSYWQEKLNAACWEESFCHSRIISLQFDDSRSFRQRKKMLATTKIPYYRERILALGGTL
jgi:hypothetical protein